MVDSTRESPAQCTNCLLHCLPSFGNPMGETYGWIKCYSSTYPGLPYYFNIRSSCSTWIKPLTVDVRLPIFIRNQETIVESSSSGRKWKSSGWNKPMIISHSQEENDDDDDDKMSIEGEINSKRLNGVDDGNYMEKEFKSEISQYPRNSDKSCGEGSVRSCESDSRNHVHDTVQLLRSQDSPLKNSEIAREENEAMNSIDSSQENEKPSYDNRGDEKKSLENTHIHDITLESNIGENKNANETENNNLEMPATLQNPVDYSSENCVNNENQNGSVDYTDYEYLETQSNDIPEYIDFKCLSESACSFLSNMYLKS